MLILPKNLNLALKYALNRLNLSEKINIIIGIEMEKIEGEKILKSNKVMCGENTNFSSTIGLPLTTVSDSAKLRGSLVYPSSLAL